MPLRAVIEGERVLAFDLDRIGWKQLQARLRRDRSIGHLPCCGAPVVAKTSKLGTQFFAHHVKGGCSYGTETNEHLRSKQLIYEACRAAGWEAEVEAIGASGTWRADVLVERDGERIAFEIQWSSQTLEETQERQERYARDGVRCYWLFRRLPQHRPGGAIPACTLGEDGESVRAGALDFTIGEFVHRVLGGRLRFSQVQSAAVPELWLELLSDVCAHCAAQIHVGRLEWAAVSTPCGTRLRIAGQRYVRAEDPKDSLAESVLPPSTIRVQPAGKDYVEALSRAGFCPFCGYFLDIEGTGRAWVVESRWLLREAFVQEYAVPHWCIGNGAEFCGRAAS